MKIPKILQNISKILQNKGAKAIVVGGSVRDLFLNLPIKDYDIEVYGFARIEELEEVLGEFGSVNLVGKSFGVLKFVYEKQEYDFSFPRVEKKVASGHRGFDVVSDGFMSFKEASKRRDFTINAMGYDIEEKKFLDPYGGLEDIERKLLRHIDDSSFVEDPLRVYRAVQFCARFEFGLDNSTKKLCQNMVEKGALEELPKERIYTEFKKLLTKSNKPSVGFELLRELGVLKYFPELSSMIGVKQERRWHPEGDVWIHTLMSIDAVEDKSDLKIMFATLCHDMGKPCTTTFTNNRISSKGHSEAGVDITREFMYRLCDEHSFIESIIPLVLHHMKPTMFYKNKAKSFAIRRLATKVNIQELVKVAKADFLGRTTDEAKSGTYEAGEWILKMAENLGVKQRPLKPLLQGRDLIELGFKPSPLFSSMIDAVYEKQLLGEISTKDEAIEFVKQQTLS